MKTINQTSANDMALCRKYAGHFFEAPENLPVSYTYGGKKYRGLPKDSSVAKRFLDANMVETTIAGTIGDLQIKAECISYRDYPAIEWTLYFGCAPGAGKTEILENVLGADIFFDNSTLHTPNSTLSPPLLVHNNGDFCHPEGYTVGRLELGDGADFAQAPAGGRPCDQAFPYQRLLFEGFGINISIGWPGQWSCEYRGTKDGVAFAAGQQISHTYIKDGELFRTPRMTLLFFEGDETRGINIWRRWFNAHVTPRQKGRIIEPKSATCENNGGIEFQEAAEDNQLASIAYIKEHFPELRLWWIDAGWYPCRDAAGNKTWPVTGDWYPDPERFPNGFAPVGKACRDAGIDLLVWHEPERVHGDSKLKKEHPEWMLATKIDNGNYLLDLTNPECHNWLCGHMESHIKESGIVCYRQDFNFEPLMYWRDNEDDDRCGMVENLYVQGYLSYWDYLLLNIPDLWIDSCASGGRRNDMETMRRSVPLHPTDYGYGHHHINQGFRHTLHSWFTFTRGWTYSWDIVPNDEVFDKFTMINGFGTLTFFAGSREGTGAGAVYKIESLGDMPGLKAMFPIWENFAETELHGDFYALTENHRDIAKWTVFQFDLPEKNTGVLQVLRNSQSADETITVMPKALCGCHEYIFTNGETGETIEASGEEINQTGMSFRLPPRSGAIWFYEAR